MNKQTIKHIIISKKTAFTLIFAVFFVILDQFLKRLALFGRFSPPIPILGDIFSLSFTKNYGIAFSIPLSGPILNVLIGLTIVILIFYWIKSIVCPSSSIVHPSFTAPLTFIILGALINLVDRLKYGYVIDYFDLKWFTVFNLADCLIVAGVICLAYLNIKNKWILKN